MQDNKMETQINSSAENQSKYATGRRKKSIARVWLKKGSGNIFINGKKLVEYFKKTDYQMTIFRPLTITNRKSEFDVKCTVTGGGLSGQVGAIVHGISRALVEFEPDLKKTLKKEIWPSQSKKKLSVF